MRFLWICATIAAICCGCSQDEEPAKLPEAAKARPVAEVTRKSAPPMDIRPAAEYLAFDAHHPWVSAVADKLREELILGLHLPDCHLSLYSFQYVERLGIAPVFELTGGLVFTGPSADLTSGAIVEGFRESGPITYCTLISLQLKDSATEEELRAVYVFRCSVTGPPALKLADTIDNEIHKKIAGSSDRERIWELILRSGSDYAPLKNDAISELHGMAKKGKRDAIRELCMLALKTCRGRPIEILGATQDRESVPVLVSILSGPDGGVRADDAADALALIGDKRAVPALIEHLKTGSASAADALKALGAYEEAYDALVNLLKTGDKNARLGAVNALGELGGEKAARQLVLLLQDTDDAVVLDAADELQLMGEPAVDVLIKAMENKDPQVRRHVSMVLKKIDDPKTVETFIKALNDDDPYVRMDAAEALGSLDDFRAVGPLTEALVDVNKEVRYAAAWALGRLGDERAVRFLISMLVDKDATLRSYAAQSLHMITREDFGDDYDKWMKWYSTSKDK